MAYDLYVGFHFFVGVSEDYVADFSYAKVDQPILCRLSVSFIRRVAVVMYSCLYQVIFIDDAMDTVKHVLQNIIDEND